MPREWLRPSELDVFALLDTDKDVPTKLVSEPTALELLLSVEPVTLEP